MDGGSRQLVSIRKLRPRPAGVVTGEVLHAYDWCAEVGPKGGPPGGTPPTSLLGRTNPSDKNKALMEKPKELRPGDIVTARFTTDLERHRIEALQVGTGQKKPQ
jgi:hypothetical protein